MIHQIFKRSAPAILAIGLLGCSNDLGDLSAAGTVLSIEEALKITAKFNSAEYRPAQRTIDDIRESLGEPRAIPENCKSIRREREEILDEVIGRIRSAKHQYLATRRAQGVARVVYREFQRGRYKEMISLLETAVSRARSSDPKNPTKYLLARPMYRGLLAKLLAETGDSDRAISALKAARSELKQAGGRRGSGYYAERIKVTNIGKAVESG